MKRYITAFFTFLGYVAFIFIMGAAIVLYIGYRKSQAHQAAVMSTPGGQVLSMQPTKQTDTIATEAQTLPHFQPISRKPVSTAKPKTVRTKPDKKTSKPAPVVSAAPVQYTTKASAPVATIRKPAVKKTSATRPVKIPARHSPTDSSPKAALGLPAELTRTYQATDNKSSPRTGRGVVTPYETTDLERQVIRAQALRELEQAANQIRNPTPTWESGILKLIGN